AQTSLPLWSISGRPSRHLSWRASSRSAKAAILSGVPRSWSARSRPGAEKNGSGRTAFLLRKHQVSGLSIKRWNACVREPVDWLPPAVVDRFRRWHHMEVEREMRKNMADDADRVGSPGQRGGPLAAR